MRKPFALAPPSARSIAISPGNASRTSATWKAIASSAARTRCARVVPRVSPLMSPRTSGSQCGEPSPVSAGTKTTPSVESTERRELFRLARVADQPEPVPQPLAASTADEDRSLEGELGSRPGSDRRGGSQESVRRRVAAVTRVHEDEAARPVRRLRVAGGEAALPEEGRLLVADDPGDRHLDPEEPRLGDDAARRGRPAGGARARRRTARGARRPSRGRPDRRASSATRSSRR